jgi:hypothetical protein
MALALPDSESEPFDIVLLSLHKHSHGLDKPGWCCPVYLLLVQKVKEIAGSLDIYAPGDTELLYCLEEQSLIQACHISNQVQSLGRTSSQTAFLHLQQIGYRIRTSTKSHSNIAPSRFSGVSALFVEVHVKS